MIRPWEVERFTEQEWAAVERRADMLVRAGKEDRQVYP